MAKQLPFIRRGGRPLPTPDPDFARTPRRVRTMADVGVFLRAERALRGLNQSDMAIRLGTTRQQLAALEAGDEGVAVGTVLRLLADLGVRLVAHSSSATETSPPTP